MKERLSLDNTLPVARLLDLLTTLGINAAVYSNMVVLHGHDEYIFNYVNRWWMRRKHADKARRD